MPREAPVTTATLPARTPFLLTVADIDSPVVFRTARAGGISRRIVLLRQQWVNRRRMRAGAAAAIPQRAAAPSRRCPADRESGECSDSKPVVVATVPLPRGWTTTAER